MKTIYCVKKENGFYFYENEPKRLKVQCTYTEREFTELVCSFHPYGNYIPQIANKLLSRKWYIVIEKDGTMTMKKHVPHKMDVEKLSKEMGKLFLPPVGFSF